jgi:hypothetical protein
VAEAVARLGLRHAVLTSGDRDDLPDGGAAHFAAAIGRIRERVPGCAVEVLSPDFKGDPAALAIVLAAMNEKQKNEFLRVKECNFAVANEAGRFRVSAFFQRDQAGMVVRRIVVRASSESEPAALPAMKTSPPSGFSSKPAKCSSVDLPVPEGATSATISPAAMVRSAPSSTGNSPASVR